jgi:squalene-associated FAD-dependent desaturase
MARTIHVIGAGLAGLSAAVTLTERGERVVVHEAMQMAGGRCRSYHDAAIGMVIDNGNHLLLSGNYAAQSFVHSIGAEGGLQGSDKAEFPFVDLQTGERWMLRLDDGVVPWWILDAGKRVPNTTAMDYVRLAPLLWAGSSATIGKTIPCSGPLYEGLIDPLLRAALNVEPPAGSAKLAGAIVRGTIAAGGKACRPLIARDGLTSVLIDPALAFLTDQGSAVKLGHQLHGLTTSDGRAQNLSFGADTVPLEAEDCVILAIPPYTVAGMLPGVTVPTEFRAIVNAHFRIEPPPDQPPILGVLHGTIEWLFAFPGRLSVTISAADRLLDTPRESLARTIWHEVATITGLTEELPPWQIVRERRATFTATPEQDARRPGAKTAWSNIFLAGDWTDTGLPATIEGAIRSGQRAAQMIGRT